MRQTWLGRCILDACLCTCRWHNRTRKCMLNEGVSTIWMCMHQMSDACLSLPWKEVHTAQDCDTNEETGHWDNSDFLTHTHTHACRHTLSHRCWDTTRKLFFFNTSSIFLYRQMSFLQHDRETKSRQGLTCVTNPSTETMLSLHSLLWISLWLCWLVSNLVLHNKFRKRLVFLSNVK